MKAVVAAGCALIALTLAASPAGAFSVGLRYTLPKNHFASQVAVDRFGDMFLEENLTIPDAAFDTTDASKIVRLNPQGKVVGTIDGSIGGAGWVGGAIAVTPSGQTAFIGGVQKELDGTNNGGIVAKYAVGTGWFLNGADPHPGSNDYLAPVAVDPSGQHVYSGAQPISDSVVPGNEIYEFDITGMHLVHEFPLIGAAMTTANALAQIVVGGPDDDIYVEVTSTDTQNLVQVYTPSGVFIRQFTIASGTGIAVNTVGDVFSGHAHRGIDVHLPDGSLSPHVIPTAHAVSVEAVDPSDDLYLIEGNEVVKLLPAVPNTTIVDAPPPGLTELLSSPTAKFHFKSSATGSTYECRLDRHGFDPAPFTPCSNPQTYPNLPNGKYRLDVRATSADGAPDPSPATELFDVTVAYAHAKITSHPAKLIGAASATFTFTSSTPGATFRCRLTPFLTTPAAFKPCASPAVYPNLKHDVYSFQVQAVTSKGYAEPNAHAFSFGVDPQPPTVSVPVPSIAKGQQLGPVGGTFVTLTWSATDPNTPSSQLVDTLEADAGPSASMLSAFGPVTGSDHVKGQTSGPIAIRPGSTFFSFRAQAQNALGIVGTSSATAAMRLKLIDDPDSAVSYSSGWTATIKDADGIGGSAARADSVGAKATLQFTGTSIGVIGVPAPGRGAFKVCVDQTCTNVDTNAATKTQRELIFSANGLGAGQHTIVLTAQSLPVYLDGFVVLH